MQVRSLGWEDLLEKGRATHSSILAWRITWTEETLGYSPRGRKELDMTEVTEHTRSLLRQCTSHRLSTVSATGN